MNIHGTEAHGPSMDRGMAATLGLLATLVVLQRNGQLKITDVIAEVGNTIDLRRQQEPDAHGPHEALAHLYELMVHTDRNEALHADRGAAGASKGAAGASKA